jgi:Peptidase family M28
MRFQRGLLPALAMGIIGGAGSPPATDWEALGRRWWAHVSTLASDRMEGRDTGSAGYERAADYVIEQFRAYGLEPAGADGYRLPVQFHVSRVDPARSTLELVQDGKAEALTFGREAVILASSQTKEVTDAEVVFIGYGLTIPELGYDDLKGTDLRGKVAAYLRGGPSGIPGPLKAHFQSVEERLRILRKAGAVGAISIPNPKIVELPWARLVTSIAGPRMELQDPGADEPLPLPLQVVYNFEHAEKLFAHSGHTFREISDLVGTEHPLPVFPLAVRIRVRAAIKRTTATSHNIAGVLPGQDPKLKDEYVVVTAHLDHLGIAEPVNGDPIYSGALDNASGVASIIEFARMIHESGRRPKRSILFLAVTGEEKGLLGSQYYATHQTVQPIVANLNFDGVQPLFPFKAVEVFGLNESSLGEDIRALGREHGIKVDSEYDPDRVLFIRSDQYNFIKVGVPSLFTGFGYGRGSPEEQIMHAWTLQRYHAPSDDVDQPIDFAAAAHYLRLHEQLLLRVANTDKRPTWNADSFFRRFAR